MPALRNRITGASNVILESNSVMRFLKPDLYLTVLDYGTADFKASAREYLDLADGVILHAGETPPQWNDVSLKLLANKPIFQIQPPQYVTPEIVDFVRRSLV
jgi:hypothetical protein